MAQVQGKYLCFGNVNNASYTLTGNARGASFGITGSEDKDINLKCINNPDGALKVVFPVENDVTIKRVKLDANGGYGIQHGVNHPAAALSFLAARNTLDGVKVYDRAIIEIPNWGDWYEMNLVLRPYRREEGDHGEYVGLYVGGDAVFYVDDFNVQDDFIGQGITPQFEFEIETAGLVIQTNGRIF